jgi:hypothetical protein
MWSAPEVLAAIALSLAMTQSLNDVNDTSISSELWFFNHIFHALILTSTLEWPGSMNDAEKE